MCEYTFYPEEWESEHYVSSVPDTPQQCPVPSIELSETKNAYTTQTPALPVRLTDRRNQSLLIYFKMTDPYLAHCSPTWHSRENSSNNLRRVIIASGMLSLMANLKLRKGKPAKLSTLMVVYFRTIQSAILASLGTAHLSRADLKSVVSSDPIKRMLLSHSIMLNSQLHSGFEGIFKHLFSQKTVTLTPVLVWRKQQSKESFKFGIQTYETISFVGVVILMSCA